MSIGANFIRNCLHGRKAERQTSSLNLRAIATSSISSSVARTIVEHSTEAFRSLEVAHQLQLPLLGLFALEPLLNVLFLLDIRQNLSCDILNILNIFWSEIW